MGQRALTWRQAARALQERADVRDQLTAAIVAYPSSAVFWECTPSSAAADVPFGFVLLDSPALARVRPQVDAFPGLRTAAVSTFSNLGGDAVLVVPDQQGPAEAYTHLAAFVRGAPPTQVHALWQEVGAAVEAWWAQRDDPVWVSTSGLGVYWLHVRLDSRPKYYQHAPLRRWP